MAIGGKTGSLGSRGRSGLSTRPVAEVLEGRQLLSTITVNTTGDSDGADGSGTLSLRQAIEISNGSLAIGSLTTAQAALVSGPLSAPNTIDFDIPGTGPFTISPTSALPVITSSVVIDGYSQPGAHPNTNGPRQGKNTVLEIELNGTQAGTGATGLELKAEGSTVQGLAIGGFGVGLSIEALSSLVQGNFIGTDVTGTIALPNSEGIQGFNDNPEIAKNNATIGGTAAGAGNLISGNTVDGISVIEGDLIQGNFIGTDITGTKALPNGNADKFLFSESATIGGTSAGAGNLISGNATDGLEFMDGNLVEGNFIGTDVTGTKALPNGADGIFAGGGSDTIGGTAAGAGNVISGNATDGLELQLDRNLIQGNFIGTDVTGTIAIPNGSNGIIATTSFVGYSDLNTIGGTSAGAGNVISGNTAVGLNLGGSSLVEGNFIGTDVTGTKPLPNGEDGLDSLGSNNTIGGTTPGASNVISSNKDAGILLFGNGESPLGNSTLVEGNFIGTDITGTKPLPNETGFEDSGNFDTIGGTAAGAGNVISGNNDFGLGVFGNSDLVEGNLIGTDITGTKAVPNADGGVEVANLGNTIGGTAVGAGNVISGNVGYGLDLGFTSILVEGNLIGTDITGTMPLPNSGDGVELFVNYDTIGGTAAGAGNTISFNGGAGVLISPIYFQGQNDPILGNSIFGNGKLGIDLGGDGVTPNNPAGSPYAPNMLQPYPVLTSAGFGGSATVISATLDAVPFTSYSVEFFSSPVADPSGFGQGKTYLGSAVAFTDASGHASFSFTSGLDLLGQAISATATDPNGNTSEFARDVTVGYQTTIELLGKSEIATLGQPTTFAAVFFTTVGAVPTGLVNFLQDGVVIGSAPLNAGGIAVFITESLSPGPHLITAAYAGNSTQAGSESNAVAVSVFAPLAFGGPSVTSDVFAGTNSVTIAFNRGLFPAPAVDLANYKIVGPGNHAITIKSAVYDPTTATVTLTTLQKLDPSKSYELTINGQTGDRVVDVFGIPLNGLPHGRPGHNFQGKIKKPPVVKVAHPSGPKPKVHATAHKKGH